MLIWLLDDERLLLAQLKNAAALAEPDAQLRDFLYVSDALEELESGGARPDVIMCDIEMPEINGLSFAQLVKERCPKTNIIFVTGYSQYALEALALHPSGYIMKPVTPEKVRRELDNLRYPVAGACCVRVQCFGNFEIFADGKPLKFRYAKTKELLAYLVDRRGAVLNTSQLCAVLWENDEDSPARRSQFRNYVADLSRTLASNGAGGVLRKSYNRFSVDTDAFECDLYDALRGGTAPNGAFAGEYMSQYSWAEMTLGSLSTGYKTEE